MAYMVPMTMGLSVLPEDKEGSTNWRWYTNQGDGGDRVRPPPKPNEGAIMTMALGRHELRYHSTNDWYRVPDDDYGTTTTAAPQYDSNDTDRQDQAPNNEGRHLSWWYHDHHQPARDLYHAAPSTTSYDGGMTSTPAYPGGMTSTTGDPYRSHSSPQYNNNLVLIERRGMSPPADPDSDPVEDLPTSCPYHPHCYCRMATTTTYEPYYASSDNVGETSTPRHQHTTEYTATTIADNHSYGGSTKNATTMATTKRAPHPIQGCTSTQYQPNSWWSSSTILEGSIAPHHQMMNHQYGEESHHRYPHRMEGGCMTTNGTEYPYYYDMKATDDRRIEGTNDRHIEGSWLSHYRPHSWSLSSTTSMTASTPMEGCDTSHLGYGKAAATPMGTTSPTMHGDNGAGGWGAYSHDSNKHDNGSGGTDHTASTSLPYDTTTRYIPRGYQTSHLVYGETTAAPTTMYDNCTGVWKDTTTAMKDNNTSSDHQPSSTPVHGKHCASGWGAYSRNNNKGNRWGATTMTNDGGSGHQLRGSLPPTIHDTTTPTPRMESTWHSTTTPTLLRMDEDHLMRNYGRLQFDRGPRAPTMPTSPQAPTKTATTTAAAPMVAASSTPAVYGDHCVGEWGAYHYDVHDDSKKGDEWDNNITILIAIPGGTRVSHPFDMMIPHPLSHFHTGLYCFPVLVYKGQATPSSSSFSSLDPCTLLHTVQWKGSSSEFHFPNVPKVAHLAVFLFGPRNALVPRPSCILPVKLSREVGSSSTCSYVES